MLRYTFKPTLGPRSYRAEVQFNVGKFHRRLLTHLTNRVKRVRATSAVYMAGSLEQLCSDLLNLAGNIAKSKNLTTINENILRQALNEDDFKTILINIKQRIVADPPKKPLRPPPRVGTRFSARIAARNKSIFCKILR